MKQPYIFLIFFWTKSILAQNIKLHAHFLLKILQAVRLGFVHTPDIGPIPFQIIEQKLVQRCDIHMDA